MMLPLSWVEPSCSTVLQLAYQHQPTLGAGKVTPPSFKNTHSLSLSLSLSLSWLNYFFLSFTSVSTHRRTAQGVEILTSGPRIIVTLNFLVISPVVADDQGVYICTASNRAGVDEASATLSIFSRSNVIAMSIQNFFNPNQEQSCNVFSSSAFEVSF